MSGYDRIFKVDSFSDEVDDLFGKNKGERHRFLNWLDKQLHILDEMGIDATHSEQFEVLTNTDPTLYAIRHPKSKLNERYIYIYCEGEDILLLTAFKEKSGSDYRKAIDHAYDIIKKLEE